MFNSSRIPEINAICPTELIKLKESTNELMDLQKILFSEMACNQVIINTFQDKIKETAVNTDDSHLIQEINIISERNIRKKVTKAVLYTTAFFFLLVFLFRMIS